MKDLSPVTSDIFFSASAAAECIFICADMSLLIPRLSASARDQPSCVKVIVVKIIYENFSIFFLETLTEKHPQTSAVAAAGAHLY